MPYIDTNTLESRCYRNVSTHVVGVIKLREYDGKPNGVALKPGEKVHMNSIEERLTGNAPKSQADNPFRNGELALIDEAAETAALEAATAAAAEPEAEEEPEAETQIEAPTVTINTSDPDPNLPSGAIPGAQDPRAKPAPVTEGSLEEVAEESAQAAEESGEAPTIEEETAVDHTEETGVKVEQQDEEVEGERAEAEEVGTPDAAQKVQRQSGSGNRRSRSKRSR